MGLSAGHRVSGVAIDRENREKDDFYPTPTDAVEALLRVEKFEGAVWECACGDGAISRILQDAGYEVVSTDLVDRGYGQPCVDFLMEPTALAPNIVTNPPFKNVAAFLRQAMHLSTGKVAMLLRLACLEGQDRRKIYEASPLARVWVFSRRLTIHRAGIENPESSGGMLAFAWFVWDHAHKGSPTLGWL